MATIQDVARRVCVSTVTVTHAINSMDNALPETCQTVGETIRSLNYRSRAFARSLQINITQFVGVLVADIANHFFAQIVLVLEAAFELHRYNLKMRSIVDWPEHEHRYLETLYDSRVDSITMPNKSLPCAADSHSCASGLVTHGQQHNSRSIHTRWRWPEQNVKLHGMT